MARILVVDDELHLRILYKKEFESEGHKVEVAANDREAFGAMTTFEPDVVILDIELGDGNGLEFLNQLRQNFNKSGVILHTAFTTYKSDFQSWLADDYIIKSSDLKPLKEAINKLLDKESCERG
ncbi:MAG: response regulator [candidate division Zixibacteria bacterium]|nr:response regulator [candidate division Zixibacteria bacterium]